jgi:hypothetical protein
MQYMYDIINLIMKSLTLFTWKDCLEICFISAMIYQFLRWLKTDQKQLLAYFYGYCATTFFAHYTGLAIVSQLLFIGAPVILCIFILLHQQTLQKNYIALKKIVPATTNAEDWIEELMRASLYAMNTSKNVIWIIERKDSLDASLQASCLFYADLKKDLIELLLETQSSSEDTMLWVNQAGKLVAINVQWRSAAESWESPEMQTLPVWQQQAILMSSKTDTLIVRSCATTRLFTIIGQGKCADNLSAHHVSLILRRLLLQHTSFQEGILYAAKSTKSTTQQQYAKN